MVKKLDYPWYKKKLAELIKRDTGLEIVPGSIRGVNRGYWRSYPECYRWQCETVDDKKLYCHASIKFVLFLGGFYPEINYTKERGYSGEFELDVKNVLKRSASEIEEFFKNK